MIKSDGHANEDLAKRPGTVANRGFILSSLTVSNLKMLIRA